MATNNVITLPTTNNTIIKEAPSMKNVQIENERFINNGLYANYDTKKVAKVLEAVDNSERKAWYETQGITLENVTSLDVALKLSGLDFEVEKKPVYFNSTFGMTNEAGKNLPPKFTKIEGQFTTVRTDTMQPFGVVTDAYEILQNRDAFDFLDSLAAEGAKFETAGFFKKNGAASYITMSTEPMTILGDEFDPYMMIMNSFDGGNAVRICLTTIRAICRNTAIMAMKKAVNKFSIQHSKLMNVKLEQAKEVLLANTHYLQELNTDNFLMPTTSNGLRQCLNLQWSASNASVVTWTYQRLYMSIAYTNELLRECTESKLQERGVWEELKDDYLHYRAEARFIRAYCYSRLCDLFGSVPYIDENTGVKDIPEQWSRKDIFNYAISELQEIENDLVAPGENEYGRIDRVADWFLQARMYLNAEVWTGESKYQEAYEYAKKVIDDGHYPLAPDYRQIFLADNETCSEIIWPLVQDGDHAQSSAGTLLCQGFRKRSDGRALPNRCRFKRLGQCPCQDNTGRRIRCR